jgi:hypothetical protein
MSAGNTSESQGLSRKDRQILVLFTTLRDVHAGRNHSVRAAGPPLRQWGEDRRLPLVDCASFERDLNKMVQEAIRGLFYEFT